MITPPKLIADDFLTEEERASSVWQSVSRRMEAMLAKKRNENDNPLLTAIETATLRGHIQFLTAMLRLGERPPAMTAQVARPGPRPNLGAKYG